MSRAPWLALVALSAAFACNPSVQGESHNESTPGVAPVDPEELETTESPPHARAISLWITGDVMSSAQIRDAAAAAETPAEGIAAMLEPLSRLWRGSDNFVLVNLETPTNADRRRAYQDGEASVGRYTAVRLNAPPYLIDGLRLAGVDAIALANNHALDQGSEGLAETIEHARAAGLVVAGSGRFPAHRWPILLGEGSAEMTAFNFYASPTRPLHDDGDLALSLVDDDAFAQVEACDSPHVVVVVHVLGELVREPEDEWREWVERFVDAGADALILHGTHVPMQVERLERGGRSAVVAWGLGNLLTDMGRMASPRRRTTAKINDPETREGLVARITPTGDGLEVSLLPVFETDDRFIRWHGRLPPGESTFWLRPLSSCLPSVELPATWPEPYRSEYADWVTSRRAHIVERTGLTSDACPSTGWLRL